MHLTEPGFQVIIKHNTHIATEINASNKLTFRIISLSNNSLKSIINQFTINQELQVTLNSRLSLSYRLNLRLLFSFLSLIPRMQFPNLISSTKPLASPGCLLLGFCSAAAADTTLVFFKVREFLHTLQES